MGLAIQTIVDSIKGLSVTGVTIKEFTDLNVQVDPRSCPVLFPDPADFITGWSINRDTFSGLKTATYTLRYTFCYKPIGSGRMGFGEYDAMVAKAAAILDKIIANDTINGCVDIQPEAVPYFGLVNDPVGESFFGCQILLRVTEFIN